MKKTAISPIHAADLDKKKLDKILKFFKGRRILVIGDVGVDRYTLGKVERISPEAPVPIVCVQEEKLKLGLAANVADNVKALGGVPLLTGVIGKDRSADDFKHLLKGAGIKTSNLVVDPSRRTVLKERIVSERQQLLRVDYESQTGVASKVQGLLLKKIRETIPVCDAIIVEDYAKGLLGKDFVKEIFYLAQKSKKTVAVDPNLKTPIDFYQGATVLTPNTKEAEKLSGVSIVDEKSLIQAGTVILKATSADFVVITRGKEGMAIFTHASSTVKWIPTYAREVYDVSGAGDTVIAVLALALSVGASIEEAAILGNLAAGVEVSKRGTATVTPDEIRTAMDFFGTMGV